MLLQVEFPRTIDAWIEELFSPVHMPARARTFPALDISEYEDSVVISAELPGVRKEELKITVENGVLTLSGERKPYEIPQDARVLMNEMRVRNFSRSIRLPREVETNKISAELENGILRIVLPKAEAARARTVEIK